MSRWRRPATSRPSRARAATGRSSGRNCPFRPRTFPRVAPVAARSDQVRAHRRRSAQRPAPGRGRTIAGRCSRGNAPARGSTAAYGCASPPQSLPHLSRSCCAPRHSRRRWGATPPEQEKRSPGIFSPVPTREGRPPCTREAAPVGNTVLAASRCRPSPPVPPQDSTHRLRPARRRMAGGRRAGGRRRAARRRGASRAAEPTPRGAARASHPDAQ